MHSRARMFDDTSEHALLHGPGGRSPPTLSLPSESVHTTSASDWSSPRASRSDTVSLGAIPSELLSLSDSGLRASSPRRLTRTLWAAV